MGQYYTPVIISEDGSKQIAYSHDYDNGLKLMEHSWVGNNFVNAVLGTMDGTPKRLAWLGDYSDGVVADECDFGGGFITSNESFMSYYDYAWKERSSTRKIDQTTQPLLFDMTHADCFAVNLTKKIYIDLEKYVRENAKKWSENDPAWCINPIPLLTSVGNGQGGGDYRGSNEEDVGSWAFDEIYITALRPGNMEEVEYFFQE